MIKMKKKYVRFAVKITFTLPFLKLHLFVKSASDERQSRTRDEIVYWIKSWCDVSRKLKMCGVAAKQLAWRSVSPWSQFHASLARGENTKCTGDVQTHQEYLFYYFFFLCVCVRVCVVYLRSSWWSVWEASGRWSSNNLVPSPVHSSTQGIQSVREKWNLLT